MVWYNKIHNDCLMKFMSHHTSQLRHGQNETNTCETTVTWGSHFFCDQIYSDSTIPTKYMRLVDSSLVDVTPRVLAIAVVGSLA